MAVKRVKSLIVCDTEAERQLSWGEGQEMWCLDTDKLYIINGGTYVQVNGGGGGDLLVKHNDITVATRPSVNFIDSASIEYVVTDDIPNDHVDVQVNYIGASGLTQQQVEGLI
jgi:hypothetical protein